MSAAFVAAAVVLGACDNGSDSRDSISVDLERDLAMVASRPASNAVVSPIEQTWPSAGPSGENRGQRAPVRPKPRSNPVPPPVAEDPVAVEQATQVTETPVVVPEPAATPTPVAVAESDSPPDRSVPALPEHTTPTTSSGDVSTGNSGSADRGRRGGGMGPAIGTVIGVIIRGGTGGIDHCDRHDRRGRPRVGGMGDIITGGRMGGLGGVIVPLNGGARGIPGGNAGYPRY